jgi:hypothetical protein
MDKLHQGFSLAIIFWGITNFSEISSAQYNVPIQPPVPSHNIMFPPRNGNKGSDPPIQRGSEESYDTPNTSSFNKYRLDRKDIFNFTNQDDPRVAAGQYVNFSGTYSGKYTVSILLGLPIKGTLNLNQSGNQVTGTLTTGMGREAALRGVVQGSQLVGKLIFNDSCAGEGTLIGDLAPTGDLMTGKYRVSDCDGKYSGRYKLKRK